MEWNLVLGYKETAVHVGSVCKQEMWTHKTWTTCNHQIWNLEHVQASLAGQQLGQKPTCSIMPDMSIESDGQETECSMRQEENKKLKDEILLPRVVRKLYE